MLCGQEKLLCVNKWGMTVAVCFILFFLRDEIGKDKRFPRGRRDILVTYFLAFEKVSHAVPQQLHYLYPLGILEGLFWRCSVQHIPITGCDDGHLHQAKIIVYLIPGGCGTCPAGRNYRSRWF